MSYAILTVNTWKGITRRAMHHYAELKLENRAFDITRTIEDEDDLKFVSGYDDTAGYFVVSPTFTKKSGASWKNNTRSTTLCLRTNSDSYQCLSRRSACGRETRNSCTSYVVYTRGQKISVGILRRARD